MYKYIYPNVFSNSIVAYKNPSLSFLNSSKILPIVVVALCITGSPLFFKKNIKMAFNNQKDGILKFYEATNEFIHQHQETYNKLVNKLNDKVGLTQKLTNNLDDFMESSFPDLNAFRQKINSQPLDDSQISYVSN